MGNENNESEIKEMARLLRNQKAKEWRDKNKEKVKESNQKYWEKKAKEFLESKISTLDINVVKERKAND